MLTLPPIHDCGLGPNRACVSAGSPDATWFLSASKPRAILRWFGISAMSLPNRGYHELPNRNQARPRLTELTHAQSGPKLRSWMGGSYHNTRTAVTESPSVPIWSHFAKCSKIWAWAAAGRLNGRVHTLPPIHDCGLGFNLACVSAQKSLGGARGHF